MVSKSKVVPHKDGHSEGRVCKISRSQGRWTDVVNCSISVAHQFVGRSHGFPAIAGHPHVEHVRYTVQVIWSKHASLVGYSIFSLARSQGPAAVAIRMMQSIVWNPLTPTQWRTSQGDFLDLLTHLPKVCLNSPLLCAATCQTITQQIGKLLVLSWSLPSIFQNVWNFDLRFGPLILPFGSHSHKRRWFQALLEGKTWTHGRLAQIGTSEGSCSMCSSGWQNEAHRLWHRPAAAEIRSDCGVARNDTRWNILTVPEHFWMRLRPPAEWFTRPPTAHTLSNCPSCKLVFCHVHGGSNQSGTLCVSTDYFNHVLKGNGHSGGTRGVRFDVASFVASVGHAPPGLARGRFPFCLGPQPHRRLARTTQCRSDCQSIIQSCPSKWLDIRQQQS